MGEAEWRCRIGRVIRNDNVHLFPNADDVVLRREPVAQPSVVAFLEHQLARAKRGEIQSAAIAYVHMNGNPGQAHQHGERYTDYWTLTTAVSHLQHRLLTRMSEDCDVEDPAWGDDSDG